MSGYVVQHFGYVAGFLGLAAIGAAGCAVLYAFLPETKPREERAAAPHPAGAREAGA
jgi:predicted MFS family arabinose efflux permease